VYAEDEWIKRLNKVREWTWAIVNGYICSVTESESRLAIPYGPPQGVSTYREVAELKESQLRAAARGLMAQSRLSQKVLAGNMETSQSSVSHMLTDRSYGLTSTEVSMIEATCQVPQGTLYRAVGFVEERPLERQIYDIPGITHQAAEAIVAAIQAVRADVLRTERQA
jgi:hypothetical protein